MRTSARTVYLCVLLSAGCSDGSVPIESESAAGTASEGTGGSATDSSSGGSTSTDVGGSTSGSSASVSGFDQIHGSYRLTFLSATGTFYAEDSSISAAPRYFEDTASDIDMDFTFNADGTYFASGVYTITSTTTRNGVTTSSVRIFDARETSADVSGDWKVDGGSFLFSNDLVFASLLSDPTHLGDPEFFEMILLEATEEKVTFEILTSIDWSWNAGYPSRVNRQGVIVLER